MSDIFISYATRDRAIAQNVRAALHEAGLSGWMAPNDIPAGSRWTTAILDALGQCRALVLVLSDAANRSVIVPLEVERAVSMGLAVVTFSVEDVRPARSMELFTMAFQWFDALPVPNAGHYADLAGQIAFLLAHRRSPGGAVTAGWEEVIEEEATRRLQSQLADEADPTERYWLYIELGLLRCLRARALLDEALQTEPSEFATEGIREALGDASAG